jgi:hypothetical protein
MARAIDSGVVAPMSSPTGAYIDSNICRSKPKTVLGHLADQLVRPMPRAEYAYIGQAFR